jgi:hexosaminidase
LVNFCIGLAMHAFRPVLAVLMTALPLAAQAPLRHTLMPVPASLALSPAQLRVDSGFTVAVARYRDPRLERAVTRAVARLEMRLGRPLSRRYGGDGNASLVINVAGRGFAVPDLAEDESYQLNVTATQATLTAATVVGAIRGLETFLQLQDADSRGLFIQAAEIGDMPRFRWRGLLLDVSRHFESPDVIKRLLDGMAMVKLNVFHWHLSDDQGFRVESRVYPRLHRFGSDLLFYTQDQIREIVAYAADRGIRVMPEFDVPGHSSAWFVGYPKLTVGAGPFTIARTWGTFEPTMDPTRESTYRFLDGFIGEIARLFPDKYWHVGGDEVDPKQWKGSASIQAYMKRHGLANEVALHTAFNKRLFAIVQKHGKVPVGWDEIFQPDLPTSAVIQSWRSSTALAASAKAGFHGILSAPYYIDHMKPASDFYLPDPLPANTDLTPAQQELVLGGEACMWGEYVVTETLASRIWPRLATIAERFWSPGTVVDMADMYRRLDVSSRRLTEFGLGHEEHVARAARRLGGDSTAILELLLDYVRPKDFGGSGNSQQFPHTRLIDAAVPDPRASWDMTGRARRAAAGDTNAAAQLREDFHQMAAVQARLFSVRDWIPAADDGLQVAGAMSDLGRVGIDALNLIAQRAVADATWRANADSLFASLAPRRTGQWPLVPTATDAVRVLVDAAKALPSPRN